MTFRVRTLCLNSSSVSRRQGGEGEGGLSGGQMLNSIPPSKQLNTPHSQRKRFLRDDTVHTFKNCKGIFCKPNANEKKKTKKKTRTWKVVIEFCPLWVTVVHFEAIYSCTTDFCAQQWRASDKNAECKIGHCARLSSTGRLSSRYLQKLQILSGSINHRAVNKGAHCKHRSVQSRHSPFPFCRSWGRSVACSCSLYQPGAASGSKNTGGKMDEQQ